MFSRMTRSASVYSLPLAGNEVLIVSLFTDKLLEGGCEYPIVFRISDILPTTRFPSSLGVY